MKSILTAFFVCCLCYCGYGARILGVLPLGALSHHRFTQPILKALALAGHEVVVYSPFPNVIDHPPNYTHVHLKQIPVADQNIENNRYTNFILEVMNYPIWKCLDLQWTIGEDVFNDFLNEPEIQKLLSSGEKFDVIITETFTAQEFTLLLSHIMKAPIIGLQAFFTNNIVNHVMGNSLSLSYIPDVCNPFPNRMNFFQRVMNSMISLRGMYYHFNWYLPRIENIKRKHFPDLPPLIKMTNNVSMMFINDHSTADYAQPRTPNIIPVGGIHIEPPKPLPQNIQKFMDEAKFGVILFSLGTYVPDELTPKEYFDMYCNIFRKLKQRVVWKTRKENIDGLPENVMTLKWVPQTSILAHPNIKLFITHGGLLSQHEAVHFGVPVISIPQFYDQRRNSIFYEQQGIGKRVLSKDVSEETMNAAIKEILEKPSYAENMKRLSRIFKDRPMSPAESAVYWTEYVIRHNGAHHLKPSSTELSWYQLALLDVILAVLTVITALIATVYVLVKKITRTYFLRQYLESKKKN